MGKKFKDEGRNPELEDDLLTVARRLKKSYNIKGDAPENMAPDDVDPLWYQDKGDLEGEQDRVNPKPFSGDRGFAKDKPTVRRRITKVDDEAEKIDK